MLNCMRQIGVRLSLMGINLALGFRMVLILSTVAVIPAGLLVKRSVVLSDELSEEESLLLEVLAELLADVLADSVETG